MLSHYEKRNRSAMADYDPSAIDVSLMEDLFEQYASPPMRPFRRDLEATLRPYTEAAQPQSLDDVDDFKDSLIQSPDDIVEMFTRQFYFGCEGDDPLTALAFRSDLLPLGRQLKPIFASDIGHWDVPDMRQVLVECWELVERGTIDEGQFKAFTCTNVVMMHHAVNPESFAGTAVEQDVERVLA